MSRDKLTQNSERLFAEDFFVVWNETCPIGHSDKENLSESNSIQVISQLAAIFTSSARDNRWNQAHSSACHTDSVRID
jgi:hypothetical protein